MASLFRNPYQNTYSHDIPAVGREPAANKRPNHQQEPIAAQDELDAWGAGLTIPRVRTGMTLLAQPVSKTLEFRKRLFNSDLFIWHKSKWHENQVYLAACSAVKSRVPDVTLHSVIVGQQDPGPILGVAHFRYSRHIRFGVGDARDKPDEVNWVEMRNISKMLGKGKYEWEFTEIPDWNDIETGNHPPDTRRFRWTRTVDVADGVETKLSLKNYRLTDEKTGAVVAVFVASTLGTVRKRGELRIFEELRPKLETAVVLTCASISEKLSRD